jgi:hypothetical protein
LDETLAIFMRALTEHALMENGGVQLSHGTLRDVRTKIGYHKVSALLEHWIPKLGDIKATPAHLRKPNSERGEDVW